MVENLERKSQRDDTERAHVGRRETYQSNNESSNARSRNGKVIADVNTSDAGDDERAVGAKKKTTQKAGSYGGNRDNSSSLVSMGRKSIHTEFERLSDQSD